MGKVKKKQSHRLKRESKIGVIVFLFCLLTGMTVYAFQGASRKLEVEYTIKPYSVEQKILSVNIKIRPLKDQTSKTFVFVKGSMNTSDEKCTDNLNRDVSFKSENGIIVIDKLKEGARYVNYSYNVTIGGDGKHGDNGQMYQDLLTFAGESVLALPIRALNYDNLKEDAIKKITVQCSIPDSWEAIIPYAKEGAKNVMELEEPHWLELYELRQATFTFGSFEKDVHLDSGRGYTVFIDPKATEYYDLNAKKGIESLYNYYSKLFNYNLDDYSIVLLRNDEETGNYIMGGLCTQNLASTFNPQNKRDWQLLSHRIFHSFFEAEIASEQYVKAPLLSLYEGLATYYENMSLTSLPENIRSSLSISPDAEVGYLFERYAYMRLKEPMNLALVPSSEVLLQQSPGRIEFLHYTQMPLTINYMEELISKETGKKDNIIRYIVENSGDNAVTAEKITNKLLGKDAKEFLSKYLNGAELLPLWNKILDRQDNEKTVLDRLNKYEYDLYTWFIMENQLYPYYQTDGADLEKLSAEADKKGVHFADTAVEESVKSSSPTIYNLLKEYALRAKVCNVDYNDTALREKLLASKSNLDRWETYKKSLK
jgi:hypothetical protein